jgi:hypothetical protein
MLNIVCVNWRNYLGKGDEYVLRLKKGLANNITGPYRFKAFVDSDLPFGLQGWYNKLYLFQRGLFPSGDRVLFFDLDTIILDNIDDLCGLKDDFAILRDFMRPTGWGSAIMSWDVDYMDSIAPYNEWVRRGKLMHDLGDQGVIQDIMPKATMIQDKVNGIYSYKVHGVLPDAKIICFHGKPRPHQTAMWNI